MQRSSSAQRLLRNAVAGALTGCLIFLPTIVVAHYYPDSLNVWLIVIIAATSTGVMSALIESTVANFPQLRRMRGGIGGAIIGLILSAAQVLQFQDYLGTRSIIPDSWGLRLVIWLTFGIAGYIAGIAGAYIHTNIKAPTYWIILNLLMCALGSAIGGGLLGFVIGASLAINLTENTLFWLIVGDAITAGTLMCLIGSIASLVSGSFCAIIGGIAGQVGDSVIGRAMGTAFGTTLGVSIVFWFLALIALIAD